MNQRHAVTKKMAAASRRSSRSDKLTLLDSLVDLTGWHRDHARHELARADTVRAVLPRRARPPEMASLSRSVTICADLSRAPWRRAR